MALIQVLIAAPNMAMRVGLRAMLKSSPEIDVCGEAGMPAELADILARTLVDVLVLAEETFAFSALRHALEQTQPLPALLVIGNNAQSVIELTDLTWRSWGMLSADASEEELTAAVRAANLGLIVGARQLLEPLLEQRPARVLALNQNKGYISSETLTEREVEVLRLLAQGLANKQIGLALNISEHTAKFHISSIYTKLGAASRTEAVRLGVQKGLIAL